MLISSTSGRLAEFSDDVLEPPEVVPELQRTIDQPRTALGVQDELLLAPILDESGEPIRFDVEAEIERQARLASLGVDTSDDSKLNTVPSMSASSRQPWSATTRPHSEPCPSSSINEMASNN